jgi:hypothetical protein
MPRAILTQNAETATLPSDGFFFRSLIHLQG